MLYNETPFVTKEIKMFHPIKAVKHEIHLNRMTVRTIIDAYKYEKMIRDSQAKLDETTLIPGYTNVYA